MLAILVMIVFLPTNRSSSPSASIAHSSSESVGGRNSSRRVVKVTGSLSSSLLGVSFLFGRVGWFCVSATVGVLLMLNILICC